MIILTAGMCTMKYSHLNILSSESLVCVSSWKGQKSAVLLGCRVMVRIQDCQRAEIMGKTKPQKERVQFCIQIQTASAHFPSLHSCPRCQAFSGSAVGVHTTPRPQLSGPNTGTRPTLRKSSYSQGQRRIGNSRF